MEGTRSALIVASDDYTDPGLRLLRAPARDAQALAAVLRDPRIGGFQVRTLLNQPAHEVTLAVEEFFADRRPDDLLLVHFSCHGVKDEDGELYFAAANTQLRRLGATAVAADFVNRRMNRSRSRRVVLLLDCCYAGAFERGMTARADSAVGIKEQFGGRGRAVITASSAMEYAFEGEELTEHGSLAPSVFTRALVTGLQTGEADRDQDGMVALDELYDYVYDHVQAASPNQTPGKWTFGVQGELYIARRAIPVTVPSPLPPELQAAIQSAFVGVRAGAVPELARLLQGRHAGLALAARLSLEQLIDDDSRMVSSAAASVLEAQAPPAQPEAEPGQPEPQLAPPESAAPASPELATPEPVSVRPEPAAAPPEPAPAEPAPAPRLTLSSTEVDFGRLPLHGRSPERRVRIGNASGGTLQARASTPATWLHLRQVGDELVVAADTAQAGAHEGVITVDSDGGLATIRVLAQVAPVPAPPEPAPPPPVPAPPATVAPADRGARPSRRARAPRRRLPLVLGAAVVVAAAAVVAAQQLGGPSTPSTTSAPGTATTVPKVAGQLGWKRLTAAALGGPGDQRMSAITGTSKQDARYLAGGFTTSSAGRDAGIWISQDGRKWERIADKDLGGPGDQVVSTVTDYGGTLMAVGWDTSGGDSDVAAWESSDGRTWDRVGASDLREPGSQQVNRVWNSGQGLLAAGYETRGDGNVDAVIWRYQRAPASWDRISGRSFEGPGRQVVWRVVDANLGYGTSYIAAGGSAGQTSGGEDAAVWISSDLRTWEPVKDRSLGGAGDQEITDLGRFGSGLIAVGFERRSGGTRGLVWLSDDGRTWTRVSAPAMTGLGPDGMLTRVVAPGADTVGKGVPKLITAGFSGTTGASDAAVWTSQTGKTWTREAVFSGPGNQEIRSLARTQTGVMAVGEATSKQGSDAAVWVGTPRQ
jgi:Caspase domain